MKLSRDDIKDLDIDAIRGWLLAMGWSWGPLLGGQTTMIPPGMGDLFIVPTSGLGRDVPARITNIVRAVARHQGITQLAAFSAVPRSHQ